MSNNDRITLDSLSIHLCNGLGPSASAFGLSPPPPCPITLTVTHHLYPRIIPLVASEESMASLGVNYSAVSKAIYALLSDTKRVFADEKEVIALVAGVCLRLDAVESVHVELGLPRASLKAESVLYCDTFYRRRPSTPPARRRRMEVRGVRALCIIGLHEHERGDKQVVEVDCALEGEVGGEERGHRWLADETYSYLEQSSSKTIEHLVENLARYLLSNLPRQAEPTLHITLRKPSAIPFATPSVSVSRTHAAFDHPPTASSALNVLSTQPKTAIYIALGSNIGDRMGNISRALGMLEAGGAKVVDTARMYESEPMYVEDQARFLNSVIRIETDLSPIDLLRLLKRTEKATGRTKTFTNGPRVVDLDLLFYGDEHVMVGTVGDAEDEDGVGWLEVPHPRVQEREFVLRPLNDIAPSFVHPTHQLPISVLLAAYEVSTLAPVIPFPHPSLPLRLDSTTTPLVMGIFNATPDSFSDGSASRTDPPSAFETLQSMMANCVPDILDIGGMSTRPGSVPCTEEEELARVIPLIQAIRTSAESWSRLPISIDTYRPAVARAAVQAGAVCINDVRGGREAGMLRTMAELDVPVVLMHSRGDSSTMTSAESTSYGVEGVVEGVKREMREMVSRALGSGIKRCNIILDPGIGFAKTHEGNIELLKGLSGLMGDEVLSGFAWLVGASRKGFIGKITGRVQADERGWGDAVVNALCVNKGLEVVRVHDWRGARDSIAMAKALR